MTTYKIELVDGILKVGFGEAAGNDQIVKDAHVAIMEVREQLHGQVAKINGPASLPVAIAIGHALAHVCPAVAAYDPKLGKYVVSITHSGDYKLGDLID